MIGFIAEIIPDTTEITTESTSIMIGTNVWITLMTTFNIAIKDGITAVITLLKTVIIFVMTGNKAPTNCAIIGASAASTCPRTPAI